MQLHCPENSPTSLGNTEPGNLTPEFLSSLRETYQMNGPDRACHNAVTASPINTLALNRGLLRGDDSHFSHRVRTKGILDQKRSGRCWIFAGLNVMRPQVIRDHNMESFEFSATYLQFWDKLEKANLYLESVIELRDAQFMDRDWEIVHKAAMEDGGWWNYLAALVAKYGVVPLSAMPETHASSNTATLNEILGRLLRSRAASLITQHNAGATPDDLRASKNNILTEVYRLLVIHLGEPPVSFDWRFTTRTSENSTSDPTSDPASDLHSASNKLLTPTEHHTPRSFYQKYVARPLSEYVCLYSDPSNQPNRHYRFDRARNMIGEPCMNFVNITSEDMKRIAISSITANESLWFAVNMNFDQSLELGLMKHRLFDYESLFGIDLTLNKADRTRFHSGASGHAMSLIGVDLDPDTKPLKWLVENSWGDDKGNKGLWTLHNDWFDEHVYTIISHHSHVPEEILKHFDKEPITLPAWYPGARACQLNP
jgi:bleomycin hydrolase